ncbi:MAG: type II toxin-antitoxin system RelE/ParE family toxin [Bacteroidales bacterium]|nr:type II toxin-antitoxin system RelE/ParE family toxin [Bacteroidales bacterium]
MVQIKWLIEAKTDLKEIYDYISSDSKRYARLQVDRIKERTQILKSFIEIGKIVEEIDKPDIRELIEGNYRIIYRVVNLNRIDILMVHHGARDLARRIKTID